MPSRRKRTLTITLGVITLVGLLSASIGEVLPEPTDGIVLAMIEWASLYEPQLGSFWSRFAAMWAYYWLSAIWYLFLAALILAGLTSQRKLNGWLKIVSALVAFFVFGFWLYQFKVTIDYMTGWNVLVGSIIICAILIAFIYWKLRQTYHVRII